jgi:hypothetical protein
MEAETMALHEGTKVTMDLSKIPALTYGVIKRNKPIVDALTEPTEGLSRLDLTDRSIRFLKLAYPEATDEDFDGIAPGVLDAAAFAVYKATFSRPEAVAPVQTNP